MTKKVLIIDDHAPVRYVLRFDFNKSGFKTFTAENGEAGIKTALEEEPDVIILDVMMPGIDGIEVCRRLKNDSKTMNTPIIMLTAKSLPKDVFEGLKAGAVLYFPKPFKFDELLAKVREILG